MEKAMSYFAFEFEGLIERHNVGKYDYTVVFLPAEIAAQLPFDISSRLRMRGEINDHPIEAAWQPAKGRYYVMLSKALVKEAELVVGHRANVRFSLVDQIQRLIANNSKFGAIWQNLSAGKQRGFMHWIGEAKTTQTRSKRIGQLIDGLNKSPNIGPMELVRAIKDQKRLANP
jgi:Bacteriocin-protection, YdeI or OmpD-Associated/Domain of unknown function (DUF1905)